MGKGHVVLVIEPIGLVLVSEQLTDLTYLRFDDSDPVLAHGTGGNGENGEQKVGEHDILRYTGRFTGLARPSPL